MTPLAGADAAPEHRTPPSPEVQYRRLAVLGHRAASGAPAEEVLSGGAGLLADAVGADRWRVEALVEHPTGGWDARPWPGVRDQDADHLDAGGTASGPWSPDLVRDAAQRPGVLVRSVDGDGAVVLPSPAGPVGLVRLRGSTAPLRTAHDQDLVRILSDLLGATVHQRREEGDRRWRADLEHLFVDVATRSTGLAPADVDRTVDGALADLGALLGASSAAVHLVVGDGAPEDAADGPPHGGGLVVAHRWSPPGAAETVVDPGADSVVVLPMHVDGQPLGSVSLVRDPASPLWPDDAPQRLAPFGVLLAGVLARARATAALHESERRYREVVDGVTDIIIHADAGGRLTYGNRAWYEFTGMDPQDATRTSPFDRIHPDDQALAAAHLQGSLAGTDDGTPREVRFLAADGAVHWMEVSGSVLRAADGSVTGLAGFVHDVTARRAAEEAALAAAAEAERARDEAERALVEAQRASAAKSEFLSRMSHELRTPLNAVLGFGQLLELADLPQEDAQNVDQILRAGRHLLDLINEVLDVVRIESGALVLDLQPVEVGEVVAESLDLVRHAATARRIVLRSPDRHGGLCAVTDRQRLKQVVINLLSNAVKYNVDGGAAVVRCAALPVADAPDDLDDAGRGWLRVTVEDTGRGIAADDLADVFTPFERLGAERTGIEGTGVGLSVAKALVTALGGRIGVASEPGRGTTFWVDLPAAAPVPAPTGAASSGAGGDGEAARTVLYVEDNPANVVLVRRILAKRPHLRLEVAHDGAAGVELARRTAPDLVLLDLHLPTTDGVEVLGLLRSDPTPSLREVPVVVVTADVSDGTAARALAAGATSVLPKPFDISQLLAVLDEVAPAP